MHRVGVDIIEIGRVEAALIRWGERFLHRIYTEAEIDSCQNRVPSLAARFAAKEAVMKVLGVGTWEVGWREIEVRSDNKGRPLVCLHGGARGHAEKIGLDGLDISLSHSRDYAIASVVGEIP